MSLEADRGDAGEEAGPALGDGEVGDVADVAVEDAPGGCSSASTLGRASADLAEGADHAEGREVDADRLEAGVAQGLQRGGDHVAAGGDDDHVDLRRRAVHGCDPADHAVVDHGLLEGHRDLLLGGEADRGVELLRVLDRGQAQGADDDPLVGDAQPHLLAELVLGEELGAVPR